MYPIRNFHPDGCGSSLPSGWLWSEFSQQAVSSGWLWIISSTRMAVGHLFHPDGCGLVSIDSAWQIPQRLSVGHLRAYYHTRNGIDIGRSLSRNSLSFFYNILHARSNLSIVIKEDKVFRSIGRGTLNVGAVSGYRRITLCILSTANLPLNVYKIQFCNRALH